MDNIETLATFDTEDTGRRQTKQNKNSTELTQNNTKMNNRDPLNTGAEPR